MLDSVKDKLLLPFIFAASVIAAAVLCMFLFFDVSPSWLRFLPFILAGCGFFGGFALSFVPVFKGRKIIPVICITILAVITGIVIAVL